MKILFWVPYPTEGASNRYRVEQYLPYLEKRGIEYSLHSFWRSSGFDVLYKPGKYIQKFYYFVLGTIFRLFDLIGIAQYDIVFIHRESYPIGGIFFERILSLLKKPIIYDFDDAIFLSASSYQNIFIKRFKRPNKVVKIIKLSKHVIAGNYYLADFSSRYNHSVSIIPTSINTDKYYPYNRESGNKVVIGWIGSVTTVDFLSMVKESIIRLSRQLNYIKFKIVGGSFSIDGLSNIHSKAWSLNEEVEDLKTFDIGIMPMPDNEWTKGKCGFKAILYMSMGIPCICSPVGINKEIINDGVNGFLADSTEEWINKFLLLIKNPELRLKIGVAGRKTVEERYSIKANVPKFLEVIYDVYNKYGKK